MRERKKERTPPLSHMLFLNHASPDGQQSARVYTNFLFLFPVMQHPYPENKYHKLPCTFFISSMHIIGSHLPAPPGSLDLGSVAANAPAAIGSGPDWSGGSRGSGSRS